MKSILGRFKESRRRWWTSLTGSSHITKVFLRDPDLWPPCGQSGKWTSPSPHWAQCRVGSGWCTAGSPGLAWTPLCSPAPSHQGPPPWRLTWCRPVCYRSEAPPALGSSSGLDGKSLDGQHIYRHFKATLGKYRSIVSQKGQLKNIWLYKTMDRWSFTSTFLSFPVSPHLPQPPLEESPTYCVCYTSLVLSTAGDSYYELLQINSWEHVVILATYCKLIFWMWE